MKRLLLLLIIASPLLSLAQDKITLFREIEHVRMGHWLQGDYKILVAMGELETAFENTSKSMLHAADTYQFADSSGVVFYKHSAKRYRAAAQQLREAKEGFDLQSLVLYNGVDRDTNNVGPSPVVESVVMDLFRKGQAIVYYKGVRVYEFKVLHEAFGNEHLLDQGMTTTIYVDDVQRYLFKESRNYGW